MGFGFGFGGLIERGEREVRGERWHQVGGLQGAKGGAMISGLISANVCLVAENPRTALFSAKTISSAFTIPKSSNEETEYIKRSSVK